MRKKQLHLAVVLAVLLSGAPCFADGFSFAWYAEDSLFPTSVASPYSAASTLNIISLIEGQPRTVRYAGQDSGTYADIPFLEGDKYADETLYAQLKTGVDIGLMRIDLGSAVESEIGFQGALNSVFQGFGGASNLGFDGIFFFGWNVRLFRTVSVRAGYRHYSGHYGDETLMEIYGDEDSTVSGFPIQYTRDNDLLVGISVQPVSGIRLYLDASLPLENSWMDPAIHIPSWVLKPTSGESLLEDTAEDEGITAPDFPDSYKAWIVEGGIDLRYPVKSVGSLLLALDVAAHQDGQTLHQVGGYEEDNPWEFEYTVAAGFEFNRQVGPGTVRLLATYHDGRFPLLNYFYQRTKYVSVGFSVTS
jgi:hypothetical protein